MMRLEVSTYKESYKGSAYLNYMFDPFSVGTRQNPQEIFCSYISVLSFFIFRFSGFGTRTNRVSNCRFHFQIFKRQEMQQRGSCPDAIGFSTICSQT